MLEILSRCGGPTGIRKAGRRKLTTIVPGTTAADTVLPRLADSLKTVPLQRKQVAAGVEEILDAHPLAGVLTSMPGIGVRATARICLARRRCDVLFAMLRKQTHYRHPEPATAPAAA